MLSSALRLALGPSLTAALLVACGTPATTVDGPSGTVARTPPTAGDGSAESSTGHPGFSESTWESRPGPRPCAGAEELEHGRLWPVPGEVFYMQLGLSGFAAGESAVIVGPRGEFVLIDVGNDSHADVVADHLGELAASVREQAEFAPRGPSTVDQVILTHYHADHVDGLDALLAEFTLTGQIFVRGMYDLVGLTDATIASLCSTLERHADQVFALCNGPAPAPCDPQVWTGRYPATTCAELERASDALSFGSRSGLRLLAVNATIGSHAYETEVEPLRSENNGENARSIVGELHHGPFRLLFGGDLTGGGSDTDPIEGFYLPHLDAALLADGVDVLHASHHARNTSTGKAWLDALVPNDGRDRNVISGVAAAHLRSPHVEVLDEVFRGGRLGEGRMWLTQVAPLGATHPQLHDAGGGSVIVRTDGGGNAYLIQLIGEDGTVLRTHRYASARTCL